MSNQTSQRTPEQEAEFLRGKREELSAAQDELQRAEDTLQKMEAEARGPQPGARPRPSAGGPMTRNWRISRLGSKPSRSVWRRAVRHQAHPGAQEGAGRGPSAP